MKKYTFLLCIMQCAFSIYESNAMQNNEVVHQLLLGATMKYKLFLEECSVSGSIKNIPFIEEHFHPTCTQQVNDATVASHRDEIITHISTLKTIYSYWTIDYSNTTIVDPQSKISELRFIMNTFKNSSKYKVSVKIWWDLVATSSAIIPKILRIDEIRVLISTADDTTTYYYNTNMYDSEDSED